MKPSLPSSLFFLSLLLLTSFALKAKSQELIESTCKTASKHDANINYAFCKTSLQAAPASRCASLKGLGKISLRLIRDNLTDTKCRIKRLMKNNKLDPFFKSCLEDCFELYSDAIVDIKSAREHYDKKKFVDANIEVTSVSNAATTCEDGFKEKQGVVSPLTKMNSDISQLSDIALSIMNMVQSNSY